MYRFAAQRAMLLGFLVSIAYWPGILSSSFVPRWAVIALGVPVLTPFYPCHVSESVRWTLLFLVAAGAVSLLGSPMPHAGFGDLIFIVILCGAFLAGAGMKSLDPVMRGLGYGLLVSVGFGIFQYFGYRPVPQISSGPSGLFFNSEMLGEFAAIVLLWAVLKREIAISIITALALAMTESRVGVGTVVIGLFYFVMPKSPWKAILSILILIVGLIGILLSFGLGKDASAMHRAVLWSTAVMNWTLLGKGLGWGSSAFPYEEFVHSDAIQAVAELGIGALALIVVPVVAFLNPRGSRAERAVFVGICFQVFVSFPLHFPATGFVAAVVAGFLVSVRPLVRLGSDLSGTENGFRGEWGDAADFGAFNGGGRLGRALPVRSLFAKSEALRSQGNRSHPAEPELVRGF